MGKNRKVRQRRLLQEDKDEDQAEEYAPLQPVSEQFGEEAMFLRELEDVPFDW